MATNFCSQCGKLLNPVEVLLGAVCGKCCRANHRAVVTGKREKGVPKKEFLSPEGFDKP